MSIEENRPKTSQKRWRNRPKNPTKQAKGLKNKPRRNFVQAQGPFGPVRGRPKKSIGRSAERQPNIATALSSRDRQYYLRHVMPSAAPPSHHVVPGQPVSAPYDQPVLHCDHEGCGKSFPTQASLNQHKGWHRRWSEMKTRELSITKVLKLHCTAPTRSGAPSPSQVWFLPHQIVIHRLEDFKSNV